MFTPALECSSQHFSSLPVVCKLPKPDDFHPNHLPKRVHNFEHYFSLVVNCVHSSLHLRFGVTVAAAVARLRRAQPKKAPLLEAGRPAAKLAPPPTLPNVETPPPIYCHQAEVHDREVTERS